MPLNQKNKNLGAAQSHVLKWLVTRHGKEQVLGLECMFENNGKRLAFHWFEYVHGNGQIPKWLES